MGKIETELRKIAIKHLKTKKAQDHKKKICAKFSNVIQKKQCIATFDKGFIDTFVKSGVNKMLYEAGILK